MTDETKAKISATLMGHAFWGPEYHSVDTRAKMSATHTGHAATSPKHQTDETRAKISVATMGSLNHYWKGGPLALRRRSKAKRRLLGFIQLNAPFVGCEGHHVDNEQVIHMPKVLHRSIYHRQDTGQGMAQMNAIAYNFLFKQEVEAALEDKREQLA